MDKESQNTIELPIPEEYGADLAIKQNLTNNNQKRSRKAP
jgi:hypothetical protein